MQAHDRHRNDALRARGAQHRGRSTLRGRERISVGIIGGGIGGLAAALSLLRGGFDVHVYEQASVLGEVGAGIQISPNASRILHRLGLAEELATAGVRPLVWHQRRWDDGRTLLRAPLAEPLEAAFGFPHYQIHRADLLAALAGAVPAERIHLAHHLIDLRDHGDRVEAQFAKASAPISTCLWAPTEFTRGCAVSCSDRTNPGSPAASPIAA